MQAAKGPPLPDALRLHSPGPYQLQAAIAAVHADVERAYLRKRLHAVESSPASQ